MEEARKKSKPVDPNAKLPQLEPIPEEVPEKKSKRGRKKKELSPEDLEFEMRSKETPEEKKARLRAALLDDLPDLPDEPVRREPASQPDTAQPPKPTDDDGGASDTKPAGNQPPAEEEDPFADIHWNDEQTTFTIRL